MAGNQDSQKLLEKLGRYKSSGGCLYIKRLADVDGNILIKLIDNCFRYKR